MINIKILTVSGTRPDFIRLIPTIKKLDKFFNHKLVWAGQNFEHCLSTQFFEEFDRKPDIALYSESYGINYLSDIMPKLEQVYKKEKPDVVFVLGDTNASLCASIVAKKLGIVLAHAEAGNRCYRPDIVPEEMNRYMIDSVADWHLCYTQRSREHLLLEGKKADRCIVIGNPIIEMLDQCEIKQPEYKDYILCTIHRKENIEHKHRLFSLIDNLNKLGRKVIMSCHPSLKSKMKDINLGKLENIKFITPTNFKDFVSLEKYAKCIISDSGTVPEEAHYLKVPCVLLRFSTERPELLESNSVIVCSRLDRLNSSVNIAIALNNNQLNIPEYHNHVSDNIIKLFNRM